MHRLLRQNPDVFLQAFAVVRLKLGPVFLWCVEQPRQLSGELFRNALFLINNVFDERRVYANLYRELVRRQPSLVEFLIENDTRMNGNLWVFCIHGSRLTLPMTNLPAVHR